MGLYERLSATGYRTCPHVYNHISILSLQTCKRTTHQRSTQTIFIHHDDVFSPPNLFHRGSTRHRFGTTAGQWRFVDRILRESLDDTKLCPERDSGVTVARRIDSVNAPIDTTEKRGENAIVAIFGSRYKTDVEAAEKNSVLGHEKRGDNAIVAIFGSRYKNDIDAADENSVLGRRRIIAVVLLADPELSRQIVSTIIQVFSMVQTMQVAMTEE